jgi:tRNA pseudouridine38-40 synthase
MSRVALDVRYDGMAFHGSQIQGALPTVQKALNDALTMLFRNPVETFGASRTDEGVHALSNFYHFDAPELPKQLQYRLNAVLPPALSVNGLYEARNPEFNCRFDALSRQYRYRIYAHKNPFLKDRAYFYPYATNLGALNETAAILKGHTHFESFCKRTTNMHSFKCTIHEAYWETSGNELHFVVRANRFLRGMVRGLVGTQLRVTKNGTSLPDILAANDCRRADFAVPGHGLYLEEIRFPEGSLTRLEEVRY